MALKEAWQEEEGMGLLWLQRDGCTNSLTATLELSTAKESNSVFLPCISVLGYMQENDILKILVVP